MDGTLLGSGTYDISYFPTLAGPHKLHFFSLDSGIDVSLHDRFDSSRPLLVAQSNAIELQWSIPGDLTDAQFTDDMRSKTKNGSALFPTVPSTDYFFSLFSGRIQFPTAEEFILRVDGDPGSSFILKVDGVVVCSCRVPPEILYDANHHQDQFGHIVQIPPYPSGRSVSL